MGETKLLRPLADGGLDAAPTDFAVQGNWLDLDGNWETILGDGVLNLCGPALLVKVRKHCRRFVVRVFTPVLGAELEWRYAKYFTDDFSDAVWHRYTQRGCVIAVYEGKL